MSEKSQASSFRVPVLKASDYPVWKERMIIFLDSVDPEYLDRIYDGPHMPTKLSVAVADEPQRMIPKEKKDYTPEDISSISKDSKVKHLLHSAFDNAMSNRMIGCKTAKQIWDALETRCQGTQAIKKNRKTILTQEYEHFDSKSGESLTDLYDRFVKLLNDLSLVDKEYDLEDSNLKFLLALPEKWDLKVTTIRDNLDLGEMSLDDVFGRLKTYELEMEQRSKRHGGKSKSVALKVQEEAAKNKGKAHVTKSDTESSNSDDDSNFNVPSDSEDSDDEMMQLAALMVKSFKKLAYKKFNKGKSFSRKDRNSDRVYDKKNFKKNEGKEGKAGKADKYTCFNCGEKGHFASECKKAKKEKEKAFITKKGNWTDTSDSEEEVNYALMANTDNNSESTAKVPHSTLAFDTEDITELRSFLISLHISFRDQTLENERLKSETLSVKKRNDYLEKELVQMLEVQKERDDAVIVKDELLKRYASLQSELAKEREIIKTWTNSGKTTQDILGSGNWKKGLGYTDNSEAESSKTEFVKTQKPKVKPVKFVVESSKPKQCRPKSEINNNLKSEKPKQVNIGLMTQKQLKHKLKEVKSDDKNKEPRKNRNGKIGIDKSNNYMPVPNAPRKTCHNCGNTNHLANFCRKNKDINSLPTKSGVRKSSIRYKPQDPCFHCGSLWHSIYTCKEYHSLYYDYYQLKPSLKVNKNSASTNSVSSTNSVPKSVSSNSDNNNSAAKANKLNKAKGSKQVWVLKTNN